MAPDQRTLLLGRMINRPREADAWNAPATCQGYDRTGRTE